MVRATDLQLATFPLRVIEHAVKLQFSWREHVFAFDRMGQIVCGARGDMTQVDVPVEICTPYQHFPYVMHNHPTAPSSAWSNSDVRLLLLNNIGSIAILSSPTEIRAWRVGHFHFLDYLGIDSAIAHKWNAGMITEWHDCNVIGTQMLEEKGILAPVAWRTYR
jgi:hypothetical protein